MLSLWNPWLIKFPILLNSNRVITWDMKKKEK